MSLMFLNTFGNDEIYKTISYLINKTHYVFIGLGYRWIESRNNFYYILII